MSSHGNGGESERKTDTTEVGSWGPRPRDEEWTMTPLTEPLQLPRALGQAENWIPGSNYSLVSLEDTRNLA